MRLSNYSTITSEQIRQLAETLAQRETPIIDRFEPIADYEELSEFIAENPTPIFGGTRNAIWRTESVAARLIEAFGIAAHEPLSANEWEGLARIVVEHAECLFTYHDAPQRRIGLEAGAALALAGCVCRIMPQAMAWRLAGFARIAETVGDAAETPLQSYLVNLIDAAYEMAVACNLPILEKAVAAYNAVLDRDLRWDKFERFRLTDSEFFDELDLNCRGLEGVKSELAVGNVEGAKTAYEAYLRRRARGSELYRALEGRNLPIEQQPAFISYADAKSRLERVRRLSTQTASGMAKTAGRAVSETGDIGIAALLYPEWRFSEQLLQLARRRAMMIVHTSFFPDGCHVDGSTCSLRDVFIRLYPFYRLAKLGGVQFSPEFDARLEKILETFIYLSQPDYYLPPLGEPNPSEVEAAYPCSLGVEIFDREDLKYIASEGKSGEPPKQTSYAFPYAGCHVMRDRWHPEAHYLLFNAGHFGESGHPRKNKLSFALHAYGRPLIVDSKIGVAAEDTVMGDVAGGSHFRSRRARNRSSIHSKEPRRKRTSEAEIVPDPEIRWITASSFDFVEGWHKEGYANDAEDVLRRDFVHKRSIFYIRGEYFILHDLALGEGKRQFEQVFHLAAAHGDGRDNGAPVCVETLEGGIARTAAPDLSNIVIAPTDAAGLDVSQLRSGRTPSHRLVYAMNRSLPTAMNVVLFPLARRERMAPEIRSIDVAADADVLATGFSVAYRDFIDVVLISDDGFAEISTSELQYRGEYLFLRFDKRGQPQWCALINGQFLKWRENVLVNLPEPEESCVRRLPTGGKAADGGRLEVPR